MTHSVDATVMPDATSRPMPFVATLDGRLNAVPMRLTGRGTIDHEIGRTEGAYVLTASPLDFSPYLLGPMLITGYPNASRSMAGVLNLFRGRSYRYTREIRFRTGDCIRLAAECEVKGGSLNSRFVVEGTLPHESPAPLEPLVESWEPAGRGKIHGGFTAAWKLSHGEYLVAKVSTDYEIDTIASQSEMLHRYVRIRTTAYDDRVEKRQDVILFRDLFPALLEESF